MDLEALARTLRAPFFARTTVNHTASLVKLVERAIEVDCFALIEVISNCHILYGRMNGSPDAVDMIAAMDSETRPTNPVLERRKRLPLRVTSSGTKIGADIVDSGDAQMEDLAGRGVIWDRTGSDDLSHRYRDWAKRQA
jgi:pyruvate/2-oxoacid:ferredoxin oxidoreductase beta subunit